MTPYSLFNCSNSPINWTPALVTGNAVIVKPASDTPLQDIFVTRLLLEGGVPGNAVQLLTGSGAKVGVLLTRSKLANAVSQTGSTEAGIDIMRNSAENLHHLGLELGGNDPLIILEDCDLDRAVSETIEGRLSNAGQTCCANKRFLVQNTIKNQCIEKLIFGLKDITVGDPFDETNYYGPMINETAAMEVEQQIQHTLGQGAKCITGGKRFNRTFIEPTERSFSQSSIKQNTVTINVVVSM